MKYFSYIILSYSLAPSAQSSYIKNFWLNQYPVFILYMNIIIVELSMYYVFSLTVLLLPLIIAIYLILSMYH